MIAMPASRPYPLGLLSWYNLNRSSRYDEELKARNQMAWIGLMNTIRQRAEETILYELIYA